jgi:hypothetical protein
MLFKMKKILMIQKLVLNGLNAQAVDCKSIDKFKPAQKEAQKIL